MEMTFCFRSRCQRAGGGWACACASERAAPSPACDAISGRLCRGRGSRHCRHMATCCSENRKTVCALGFDTQQPTLGTLRKAFVMCSVLFSMIYIVFKWAQNRASFYNENVTRGVVRRAGRVLHGTLSFSIITRPSSVRRCQAASSYTADPPLLPFHLNKISY